MREKENELLTPGVEQGQLTNRHMGFRKLIKEHCIPTMLINLKI